MNWAAMQEIIAQALHGRGFSIVEAATVAQKLSTSIEPLEGYAMLELTDERQRERAAAIADVLSEFACRPAAKGVS
jgi:hypothetical protein